MELLSLASGSYCRKHEGGKSAEGQRMRRLANRCSDGMSD